MSTEEIQQRGPDGEFERKVSVEAAAAMYESGGFSVCDCAEAAGVSRPEMEAALKSLGVTAPDSEHPCRLESHEDPYQQSGSSQTST